MSGKKKKSDARVSTSRRAVIRKLAYTAPVVISSFFFSKAHAVPPSDCNPNCNPCGPKGGCQPTP